MDECTNLAFLYMTMLGYMTFLFCFCTCVNAVLQTLPSPRNFKSHVAYKLIPGGEPHTTAAKYISIYRNPKDVVVSAFHHFGNLFCPEKSWDEFFEDFMSGKFEGPSGNCLEFFLDWWKHKGKSVHVMVQHQLCRQVGWDQAKCKDISRVICDNESLCSSNT